jgi:uncharacterized membrane protein YebE (DUF533 family)
MTSFFEHQKLSFRKNYLRNLICLASVDGHLSNSERTILYSIGHQRNLKDWQIEELLEDITPFEVFIPDSIINRMNLLYDLMRLLFADGVVDENEVVFIKQVLSAFNLEASVFTELLILFKDGTPSPNVWSVFTASLTLTVPEQRHLTIL